MKKYNEPGSGGKSHFVAPDIDKRYWEHLNHYQAQADYRNPNDRLPPKASSSGGCAPILNLSYLENPSMIF